MLTRKEVIGIVVGFIIFVVYVVTNVPFYKKVTITGDEPHYLLIAKTLWERHTLDLKESYNNKTFYKDFYKGDLDPHISLNSIHSHWYSIHQYGFPVLLIPIIIIGKTINNYVLPAYCFMSLLLSISSVFFYDLLKNFYKLSTFKIILIITTIYLSLPLLVFSKFI